MLNLYYAPGTCALATHLTLEMAEVDHRAIRLDFGANQQRLAEYLRRNPKGRVPALVTDEGVPIDTFPHVAQHHQRMLAMPAVAKVMALHQ
jgi:glutathione S-transferase